MEVGKSERVRKNLDRYICGFIDGTLNKEEEKALVAYLGEDREALRYFRKVVFGKQVLDRLKPQKAPDGLEGRFALKLALEKMCETYG